MFICRSCGKKVDIGDRVGRKDDCPHCSADLHACRQCQYYEPGHHNDCRENQAEFVSDKERSNFCGYFTPAAGDGRTAGSVASKSDADKMWEQMFGKK